MLIRMREWIKPHVWHTQQPGIWTLKGYWDQSCVRYTPAPPEKQCINGNLQWQLYSGWEGLWEDILLLLFPSLSISSSRHIPSMFGSKKFWSCNLLVILLSHSCSFSFTLSFLRMRSGTCWTIAGAKTCPLHLQAKFLGLQMARQKIPHAMRKFPPFQADFRSTMRYLHNHAKNSCAYVCIIKNYDTIPWNLYNCINI